MILMNIYQEKEKQEIIQEIQLNQQLNQEMYNHHFLI